MLDKDVAKVLMGMDADYWRTYLRRDGKILVKLDKIMYGFKEATYWWNVTLTKVFLENGYKQMSKDKCVFVKSENNQISYCAITVDDCFFAATRNQEWIQSQVDMVKTAFEELTLDMERDKRRDSWISLLRSLKWQNLQLLLRRRIYCTSGRIVS